LDKHFGTNYLISSDKALSTIGGCGKYRPDKLYTGLGVALIVEFDEHQHTGFNYSCDERRISEIFDDLGTDMTSLRVIRFNPDSYKGPRVELADRYRACITLMKRLMVTPPSDQPITIHYLYYNKDSETICKNMPVSFEDGITVTI
jgi:hypothetical protein